MTINIQDLLRELVSYTDVRTSNISLVAKSVLSQMREEFQKLEESQDANKQAKMIQLLIGGTILALKQDDWKYPYSFELYPKTLTEEVFRTVQDNTLSPIEIMYGVGKQALLNLPNTFNGNIFKIKGKLINSKEPIPFFPELEENAKKIDLLVKFCIQYAENLDQAEVEAKDLGLDDLQVSESVKITETPSTSKQAEANQSHTHVPSTSFSNTSMQILSGFIVAIGVAAVAVGFVALNAATFGLAGLIVAGLGAVAILGGVGLFATGTYYRKHQSTPDVIIDDYLASIPM